MTPRNHGSVEAHAAPVSDAIRTLIGGRYEIIEESARPGGFAGYKVRHVLLDSLLLLTALPEEIARDAQGLGRVGAAVRAAGRLRHDHIVPVLDLVEKDGRYFIVESFADGVPLERLIAASPPDAPDALHVARQLADALAYAHAAGVFHGTVSPANILIEEGSPPRASLSGFVLAALSGDRLPIPAPFLPYTAPERLAGQAANARADVFAVGQVLFELFERRPLLCGDRRELEALLCDGRVPLLPRFSRMVPAGLSGLVARTIRRSAGEREQQMTHVRADLDACLRSVGQRLADEPETPPESPEPSRPVALVAVRIDADQRRAAPGPASRATMPAGIGSGRRSLWPVHARREASFPPRILVRVRGPRRTSLGGKVLMAAATVAIGWVLVPFAPPPPARCVSVDPIVAPEPRTAASEAPAAEAPAESAATPAEQWPIDGREPVDDRVVRTEGQGTTLAAERDAESIAVRTRKSRVRR